MKIDHYKLQTKGKYTKILPDYLLIQDSSQPLGN